MECINKTTTFAAKSGPQEDFKLETRSFTVQERLEKEDTAKRNTVKEFASTWPARYWERFQRWYERRCNARRGLLPAQNFDMWMRVNYDDCFHHMRNWDAGLKKALMKDQLIDKTRNVVRRYRLKEKRANRRHHGKDISGFVHEEIFTQGTPAKYVKLPIMNPKTRALEYHYVEEQTLKDAITELDDTPEQDIMTAFNNVLSFLADRNRLKPLNAQEQAKFTMIKPTNGKDEIYEVNLNTPEEEVFKIPFSQSAIDLIFQETAERFPFLKEYLTATYINSYLIHAKVQFLQGTASYYTHWLFGTRRHRDDFINYCKSFGTEQAGETGQSSTSLEPTAEVTQTANITIVDERPVDHTTLHTGKEVYSNDKHADIAENDWSLRNVLTREYPVKNFEWKVGQKITDKIIEEGLPKILTDETNNLITRQLSFFSFLRCGVKIRIQLNGTKFHNGRLIAYFRPLTWTDDRNENFYGLTCFPHGFIDASVSNSVEIEIPFTHLLTYFSQEKGTLFNDSINSLGTLVIRPFNPLQAAVNSSQSLFGQVYVSLLDPHVHLPNSQIENFSYSDGYAQGLEGMLKKGAGSLINSGLGLADKFTGGLVTGAGDAICNMLGVCDKPTHPVSADPIINRTVAPLCHGAGLDRSVRLGLSPIAQTNTDPSVLGAVDSDFDLLTLCKMPSLLTQFEWNTSRNHGDKLFDTIVNPCALGDPQWSFLGANGEAQYQPTMLAYVSRAFLYYRGTIKVKIQVVATQFHSGRLYLIYDPHGTHDYNITDISKNKNYNTVILDIQEKQEAVVELPYYSIRPWTRCDHFRGSVNLADGSAVNQPNYLDCDSTGVFRIYVMNSLVRPENVTDKVQVNIFMYAGEDFELAVPQPVAPLSVRKAPDGITYGNDPRYAWCTTPASTCVSKDIILSLYNAGLRFIEEGYITPGPNWYESVGVTWTADVIQFIYEGSKLKIYLNQQVTGECVKLIKNLPNYKPKSVTSVPDVLESIKEDTKKNRNSLAYIVEPEIQNIRGTLVNFKDDMYVGVKDPMVLVKENSITSIQKLNDLDTTVRNLCGKNNGIEQGLESYTTTREDEGAVIPMTSGHRVAKVAPDTLSENGMNLQTLLRRFWPVYVSPDITNSLDFTIISVPVTPSFVPNTEWQALPTTISRRIDVHNLAWFSRLYTYWRGSMRYKLLVNSDDADIFVWHNPVDAKDFTITGGFQQSHVAEQLNFASDVAVTRVQQGLEVEVPFFSGFNQLLQSHITNRADLRAQNGTLHFAVRNRDKPFTFSLFISTGDDFFMNVLRSPPVVYEPQANAYVDDAVRVSYPEFQRSLGHDSIQMQQPGTAVFNRWTKGGFHNCEKPPAPIAVEQAQDFSSAELPQQRQQMVEQMRSAKEIIKDHVGITDLETKFDNDIKPAVENADSLVTEMKAFLDEFKNDTLPAILGHAKVFHQDVKETQLMAKEFLPKVNEAMEHLQATMIGVKNASDSLGFAGVKIGEAAEEFGNFMTHMSWAYKTMLISTIWLNLIEMMNNFTWTNLLNTVCLLCSLFRMQVAQIIQWLVTVICDREDTQSKATNGPAGLTGGEQSFATFVEGYSDECSIGLAAVATVLYCAIFGQLPSWTYIKKVIKETVQGKEQGGLGDFLRSMHFSNLGIKAINNAYSFFKDWMDRLVRWYLQTDCPEVILEKELKGRAKEVEDWLNEIAELEDEDFYHLALSDVDAHNRFYRLMDKQRQFTRWIIDDKVSRNVTIIIRDATRRLLDMVKRINAIRPAHGFRYSPFVVMMSGKSGVAKSNMMHKFSDLIREELKIPYYHSVITVPKTKEFLDGYEGQAIVEWDDILQCPKQDEMVAEFINWRSNADCIINKAHVDEKGMHFTSKAIIMSSNMDDIRINTIRDMDAFKNRLNLHFKCYLRDGVTTDALKNRPRDPTFSFVKLHAYEYVERNDTVVAQEVARNLTLAQAIDLARDRFQKWNQKQNELVDEYMMQHGSLRMPSGVIIEREAFSDTVSDRSDDPDLDTDDELEIDNLTIEQPEEIMESVSFTARVREGLDEVDALDAEQYVIHFNTLDLDHQNEIYINQQMRMVESKRQSTFKRYWEILKRKLALWVESISKTVKDFYAKHPTAMKAIAIVSMFTTVGFMINSILKMFSKPTESKEENAYNGIVAKTPTKIIKAESAYDGAIGKTTPKVVQTEDAVVHRQKETPLKAELVEEGCDDIDSLNLGRSKVYNLTYLIGWQDTDHDAYLQCLAIGGKMILAPHHFFRRAKPGEMFFFARAGEKILVEYVPERMFRIRDKDACLYYMGPTFDSRKNIVDCFVEEKHIALLNPQTSAVLVGMSPQGIMVERPCVAKANVECRYAGADEEAPVYIQHGWEYAVDTVSGECGSTLLACNKKLPPPAKIVGMHTAGFIDRRGGFSIVVTREMIQETLQKVIDVHGAPVYSAPLPPKVSNEQQAFIDKVKLRPEGDFSFYGVMDGKYCPSQPEKTQIRATPFQGQLYDVVKKPAMLKVDKVRGISPLKNALGKYGKLTTPFKWKHIKAVKADILNELMQFKSDLLAEPTSEEVAVFGTDGVHYCEKMNMRSSPGWPYQCEKESKGNVGKHYLFDEEKKTIVNKQLIDNLQHREEEAKKGYRVASVWRDCLKDELRPIEKVEAGKTRLFTIAPVDFTILVRKYFLAFEQMFYKHHGKFFSAVGVNPESYEWTEAYRRLNRYGDKCIAGDFAGYDGTLMADLMAETCEIIDEWYKLNGEKDEGGEITNVRRVLFDEMIHTMQLVQNCVYKTHKGNPSGNPLTVVINTIVNAFYMRLAWMEIMEEKVPVLSTMYDFHENVMDEAYGDDNRLVVKWDVIHLYNQVTITECLARHGITYTDETKSGEIVPFRKLIDTSFLKRSYRQDPEVGKEILLPVIDKASITELTNWYRDPGDDAKTEEQLIANQRAALDFAFFHGREFYNEFNRKFTHKLREFNFKPICITYDEQLDKFCAIVNGDPLKRTINFIDLGF